MAKVEIELDERDINNSSDGQFLNMVDEGSFGSGDDKSGRSYLEGEDDASYNFSRDLPDNGVTYRFVQVASDHALTSPGETDPASPGQFYVIGNSNAWNTSPTPKGVIQRETGVSKTIKKRDDKRRATHNEVERRRRDKINSWIAKLAGLVPATAGQPTDGQSKGGILAKACDYITDLTAEQARCEKCLRENEKLALEVVKLKKQLADAWNENALLKSTLEHKYHNENSVNRTSSGKS